MRAAVRLLGAEVADSGRPSGVEVELVVEFAERIDAEVVWYPVPRAT